VQVTMMSWLEALTDCGSKRSRECEYRSRNMPIPRQDAPQRHSTKSVEDLSSAGLPDNFFLKLADWCTNDYQIAIRIIDDRTCPLFWGEAKSLQCLFLQMCIRDKHTQCRGIWDRLSEYERRDLLSVYHHGPPSYDFFIDIMVHQEDLLKDVDDCASSRSAASTAVSDTSIRSMLSNWSRS